MLARRSAPISALLVVASLGCASAGPRYQGCETVPAGQEALDSAGAGAEKAEDPVAVISPVLDNQREMASILEQEYPSELVGTGTNATVRLRLFISDQGEVERSVLSEGSGTVAVDRAAMRVAYRLRFRPAIRAGCTVAVWVDFPIGFVTDDR